MAKLTLTDDNFDAEVLKSDKIVLVDFWATWCGPCRVQGPLVEQLANEVGERYKIGAMEVDENPRTTQMYNILSIPTTIIFKNGKPTWQASAIQQKETMLRELQNAEQQ